MRARFLSRRENKQRKRERRKRKQFRNHLLSAPCFFLIYLYMENRTPPSGFSHCNKTGGQKVFSLQGFAKRIFPLSERERSEKRTAGLINTRPAHVLSSTNRIESVDPPPFRLERLYPPRCCDSRSSWAVVPERISPRRLG